MKTEFTTDKVIVYLYQYKLSINDIDLLNKEIKNIIIKLIKKYNINFFGYSKVSIYNNSKYGSILEIEKLFNSDFNSNIIDLKIIIYKNYPMYLEFYDYFFDIVPNKIINRNNRYLINVNDIDSIEKYIEYAKINYSDNS